MKKRIIFASRDTDTKMKLSNQTQISVYSFFPIDRHDCECQPFIEDFKVSFATLNEQQKKAKIDKLGYYECPANKQGKKRFEISCNNCGEVQGYCWATDATLTDWIDFHYVQWTNGSQWFGCFTPNVSPVDGKLTLECTCGQDTRDFRVNMTLPGKQAFEIENKNKVGREYNKPDSKFDVKDVTNKEISAILKGIGK